MKTRDIEERLDDRCDSDGNLLHVGDEVVLQGEEWLLEGFEEVDGRLYALVRQFVCGVYRIAAGRTMLVRPSELYLPVKGR